MITLNQARKKAEKMAKENFEFSNMIVSAPFIRDYYLEEDGCWMFFLREDIKIPSNKWMANVAFIISKEGEERLIGNLIDNIDEAKSYNKEMSDYFISW